MNYDVIVIGSGAGGLTTAIVAALDGLKVLVVEKTSSFGGTTALSGGAPWIPNNRHMAALGQEDSVDAAKAYLRSVLGNYYNETKVSAYLESGPEMIAYLEDNTDVLFYPVPIPDYMPGNPGARAGRTMLTREYDGRALGSMIRQLRNPLPGFAAFGTFQVDPMDLGRFKKAFRTWDGFTLAGKRMVSFLLGKLRYGKGTHLANGNALAGRLLKSAKDAGVALWADAPVASLTVENGRVVGATVLRGGKPVELRARRAVVLATGGFGGNKEMTARAMPMPQVHVSVHPEGNVGDGLKLGQSAGGVMGESNPDNGVWAPVSVLRDADGKILAKYPHFGPDRAKPGSIIVGPDGKRFVNEAAPYQPFVNTMHEQGIEKAWFIASHSYLRNYGMGLALPAPLPFRKFVRNGYLIEAPALDELARKIGVDPATLAATVSVYNANVVKGIDPEFQRGQTSYDHSQGDFETSGHPNLGPVGEGPYYALALYPGDVSSVHGLETSCDSQVLDADGKAIPGLYAVGLDQNTVMRGFYPGGGSGIGPAMTFGYRAARHIAAA